MAKLKLPMYEEVDAMSPKEVKKELKRLKPIALKRIKNIIGAGKTSYIEGISKKLISGDINDDYIELQQISLFLRKPFSKLSNIRKFEKDMLKKLHERGYDIEPEDITSFNDFMGEVKAMYKGRRIPDSTRVAEAFIQAQRLKMSKRALISNLDYWREHLEELQELASSRSKTKYSADYIKNRILRYK